jgi:hydrogenase maturation factor HypE
MQAGICKRRLKQEKRDAELLQTVLDGLSYRSGPTGALQETLCRAKYIQQEKQTKLHAAWRESVYQKVQDRIQQAVDDRTVEEIEARLQRNMQVVIYPASNGNG